MNRLNDLKSKQKDGSLLQQRRPRILRLLYTFRRVSRPSDVANPVLIVDTYIPLSHLSL